MKTCRICSFPIEPFIDFGKMPIANGFLAKEQFSSEYFYDMELAFCEGCLMVQLVEQPDRDMLFHENYAFYSSTSKAMAEHFEEFANDVIEQYSPEFVVEIGSNDGIMLRHFKGVRHLGIEPSANVAEVARKNGINTTSVFFDEISANSIVEDYNQADVILAANVMCHISDIHSVMSGVENLLSPDGVLIFEDPYLGDIIEKTSYDQIYDEHVFYFSLNSVISLVQRHGLEVINVEHQEVHGGSMRYTIAHMGKYPKSPNVLDLLMDEYVKGFEKKEMYLGFKSNVQSSKDSLIDRLRKIKQSGGRIVGYGATSKSSTITNFCGIGPELIDYICDTTPIKQVKFSPGVHIPVKPYLEFVQDNPTHALLFAWNHKAEIMAKEQDYKGKWIVYVPEVKLLES